MKILFILFFVFTTLLCYAQSYGDSNPCDCSAYNNKLKTDVHKGKIDSLWESFSNNADYMAWSTSVLKPDTSPPPVDENPETDPLRESVAQYDNWSCMYSAYKAMDRNPSTAWVEGVKGAGIGEILLAQTDITRKVQIWAGLGKSDAFFKANNRPKKIRIYLFQAVGMPSAAQNGIGHSDLILLNSGEIELKDLNDYQDLPLPPFELKEAESGSAFIAVEILSVYRGTKYDDTCISEIGNPEEN